MKIAIVGGCPSTEYMAPYADPDWEIWVHGNQMDRHLNRRVTRIFEIHEDLSEHDPDYADWLVGLGIPMVVSSKFPMKADWISVFPDECDVLEELTSTPAYMMALAIHEGATDIALYGVDMAVDDHEYFKQRPAMYAWIGYAKGRGINVTVADGSSLFVDKYKEGRDWRKKADTPFSEQGFLEMTAYHQEKIEELSNQVKAHSGCLQVYTRLAKVARGLESGQDIKNLTDSLLIRS